MKIALQHLELKSKEMICIHIFTKLNLAAFSNFASHFPVVDFQAITTFF